MQSKIPQTKSGLRPPTATAAVSAKTKENQQTPATTQKAEPPTNSEDPIDSSLQIREANGGINTQLTEDQVTQKKIVVSKAPKHSAPKKTAVVDLVSDKTPNTNTSATVSDSKIKKLPTQTPTARPTTAQNKQPTVIPKTTTKTAITKSTGVQE